MPLSILSCSSANRPAKRQRTVASLLLSGNEGCWIGVVKPGRLVRTADRAVAGHRTSLSLCVWVACSQDWAGEVDADRELVALGASDIGSLDEHTSSV